jgi:rRNA-processing protein FCF1
MKKVLLDTNMMLAPVQFRADIYEMITADFYTLDKCIGELQKIAGKRTKSGLLARAAMLLAKTKNVKVIKSKNKDVDQALVDAAKEGNYTVATNDRELIKALKDCNIRVIRLRQKKLFVEE